MNPRTRIVLGVVGGLVVLGLVAVAAVVLMPPSNIGPGQTCTLIGCADGLTVTLEGSVPEAYTVSATWDGGEQTFVCDSNAPQFGCFADGVRIDGATPDRLTITVTWEGGSKTEEVQPTYEVTRPNGPNCEPECRQGAVTISLP